MSKAYSIDEARDHFLDAIRTHVLFWNNLPDKTEREKLNGLVFSILSIIDGCGELPEIDLALCPHESDKQYSIENDDDYYEPGMIINDCMLHELWKD